jgi:hypothetical protein
MCPRSRLAQGHDYKVRIDGDYIYVQWINLPPELQSTDTFTRSDLKKSGDKWIGKRVSNVP